MKVHVLFAHSASATSRAKVEIAKAVRGAPKSADAQYWAGQLDVRWAPDSAEQHSAHGHRARARRASLTSMPSLPSLRRGIDKPASARDLKSLQPEIDVVAHFEKECLRAELCRLVLRLVG